MNLNEIIETIRKVTLGYELGCAEIDEGDYERLRSAKNNLTPRSMDQKHEHDQWCLVFDKSGACFVGKYIKPLDSFIDEIGTRKSSSFKWLPAPQWKETND